MDSPDNVGVVRVHMPLMMMERADKKQAGHGRWPAAKSRRATPSQAPVTTTAAQDHARLRSSAIQTEVRPGEPGLRDNKCYPCVPLERGSSYAAKTDAFPCNFMNRLTIFCGVSAGPITRSQNVGCTTTQVHEIACNRVLGIADGAVRGRLQG